MTDTFIPEWDDTRAGKIAALSARTRNCILNSLPSSRPPSWRKALTLEEIMAADPDKLLKTPNFGNKSYRELVKFQKEMS